MAQKAAEHSAWAQINRRLADGVLFAGERERPYYLGTLVELQGNEAPHSLDTRAGRGSRRRRSRRTKRG